MQVIPEFTKLNGYYREYEAGWELGFYSGIYNTYACVHAYYLKEGILRMFVQDAKNSDGYELSLELDHLCCVPCGLL